MLKTPSKQKEICRIMVHSLTIPKQKIPTIKQNFNRTSVFWITLKIICYHSFNTIIINCRSSDCFFYFLKNNSKEECLHSNPIYFSKRFTSEILILQLNICNLLHHPKRNHSHHPLHILNASNILSTCMVLQVSI